MLTSRRLGVTRGVWLQAVLCCLLVLCSLGGAHAQTANTHSTDKAKVDQWSCAKQYRDAGKDQVALRTLIVAHLSASQSMLQSKDISVRRNGLCIALGAATHACWNLKDYPLAESICTDYLLTNLDAAYKEPYKYPSAKLVQDRVVQVMRNARNTQGAIALINKMLNEKPSGQDADVLRVKLANIYVHCGKYDEAIKHLSEIGDSENLSGAKNLWIPQIKEQKEGSAK